MDDIETRAVYELLKALRTAKRQIKIIKALPVSEKNRRMILKAIRLLENSFDSYRNSEK